MFRNKLELPGLRTAGGFLGPNRQPHTGLLSSSKDRANSLPKMTWFLPCALWKMVDLTSSHRGGKRAPPFYCCPRFPPASFSKELKLGGTKPHPVTSPGQKCHPLGSRQSRTADARRAPEKVICWGAGSPSISSPLWRFGDYATLSLSTALHSAIKNQLPAPKIVTSRKVDEGSQQRKGMEMDAAVHRRKNVPLLHLDMLKAESCACLLCSKLHRVPQGSAFRAAALGFVTMGHRWVVQKSSRKRSVLQRDLSEGREWVESK